MEHTFAKWWFHSQSHYVQYQEQAEIRQISIALRCLLGRFGAAWKKQSGQNPWGISALGALAQT